MHLRLLETVLSPEPDREELPGTIQVCWGRMCLLVGKCCSIIKTQKQDRLHFFCKKKAIRIYTCLLFLCIFADNGSVYSLDQIFLFQLFPLFAGKLDFGIIYQEGLPLQNKYYTLLNSKNYLKFGDLYSSCHLTIAARVKCFESQSPHTRIL